MSLGQGLMAAESVGARQFSTAWIEGTNRRRLIILTVLAIALSLGFARFVLMAHLGAVGALLAVVSLVAIGIRPRYGLYLLLAAVLLFDGTGDDPLMVPGLWVNLSLQTTLNLAGAVVIPFEMMILLAATVWLAQATMRRRLDFRAGFLGRPMLLFGAALVFGVLRGLAAGGNPNYAIWESRFLFSMVVAYVLTANTIRTRAHVRTLLHIIFVCVGLSALEGLWRKFVLINSGALGYAQEFWFGHEAVVIWGLMIILVIAQQVFRSGPLWQRLVGPLVAVAAMIAMLVSERRAGLIAVAIAFALLTLSLWKINRKAFLLIALPGVIAAAVYLPLFWNSPGTLGQGARAVRSISSPDPRDAASNAWRDLEAINVRATIASDPLLGIGFGRPFLQIVTVPDISFFEFWNYESHHNILWVWMKTGAVGFIAFFAVFMTGIARSIWLAKSLREPELKTFALVGMSAIVMSMVFCYVDLGLTLTRIPLLLGVVLGTIGVLDRISQQAAVPAGAI